MRSYKSEKHFYVNLMKRDDVYEAALYLEKGSRMIEFAEGSDYMEAIVELPNKVSAKANKIRANLEGGSS